ncbi:NADH-quinone oxidoreductase subunit K [Sinomonas atrocyanea]
MTVYAYIVAGAVMLVGIAGIATSRNLVHAVVSLSVAQSATYILLIAVGYQNGGLAPIFGSQVGRDTPSSTPSCRR